MRLVDLRTRSVDQLDEILADMYKERLTAMTTAAAAQPAESDTPVGSQWQHREYANMTITVIEDTRPRVKVHCSDGVWRQLRVADILRAYTRTA